jgi:hypothetical protein
VITTRILENQNKNGGRARTVVVHCSFATSLCPSWITFIWRRPKIKMRPYNMCLPLSINGDAPAFGTKRRHALITCNAYYPSNQIRVTSNVRLPLTTKVIASPILHKLRHTTKTCVSFLSSIPMVGRPSRACGRISLYLETTAYGHVFDSCLSYLNFFT